MPKCAVDCIYFKRENLVAFSMEPCKCLSETGQWVQTVLQLTDGLWVEMKVCAVRLWGGEGCILKQGVLVTDGLHVYILCLQEIHHIIPMLLIAVLSHHGHLRGNKGKGAGK
jgi:hypothetical protein